MPISAAFTQRCFHQIRLQFRYQFKFLVCIFGASTRSRFCNTRIFTMKGHYYKHVTDRCFVTSSTCPARPARKMVSKPKRCKRAEFIWTKGEAELLLKVTHTYKVQHLLTGTCWESVQSKYADILELFKNELPEMEEEASETCKNYPHTRNEITKEILAAKLKTIRTKFRQVRHTTVKCVCIIIHTCTRYVYSYIYTHTILPSKIIYIYT